MARGQSEQRAAPRTRQGQQAMNEERIILRSLPKVLFLYPTLLAALAAGLAMRQEPSYARAIGLIFLLIFFLNMVVFSFDFPRSTSFALFFGVVAIVLAAVLINEHVYQVLPRAHTLIDRLAPVANDQFYWTIAGGLVVMFLAVLLFGIRFDYWQIDGNQVTHHHGLWHGIEHYPASSLRVQVEITDVFELFMLRSGRLIISLPETTPVVLENVVHIRRQAQALQSLLDRINVEVVGHDNHHHQPING